MAGAAWEMTTEAWPKLVHLMMDEKTASQAEVETVLKALLQQCTFAHEAMASEAPTSLKQHH